MKLNILAVLGVLQYMAFWGYGISQGIAPVPGWGIPLVVVSTIWFMGSLWLAVYKLADSVAETQHLIKT